MGIPILVEPVANGYRATTGGPLDLMAEASSTAQAVTDLRAKIARRLSAGAMLIEQPIPPAPTNARPLAENPLFDQWLEAVEEYRVAVEVESESIEGGRSAPRVRDEASTRSTIDR